MSRLSRYPVGIPAGAAASVAADGTVTVKGGKGELSLGGNDNVEVTVDGDKVRVRRTRNTKHARCVEGTYVRRIASMATGVSEGFSRRLELHGTGFRAALKGRTLDLAVGYSHPVSYELPDGVDAETPSATEVVVSGIDDVLVGQVAADIRRKRPPECYKGKGIRYAGERIVMKETKKK